MLVFLTEGISESKFCQMAATAEVRGTWTLGHLFNVDAKHDHHMFPVPHPAPTYGGLIRLEDSMSLSMSHVQSQILKRLCSQRLAASPGPKLATPLKSYRVLKPLKFQGQG